MRAWVAERSETNVSSGASARSGLRPSRGQGVRGRVLGRECPLVDHHAEFRVQSLFELTNSKPTKLALKAVPSEQRAL